MKKFDISLYKNSDSEDNKVVIIPTVDPASSDLIGNWIYFEVEVDNIEGFYSKFIKAVNISHINKFGNNVSNKIEYTIENIAEFDEFLQFEENKQKLLRYYRKNMRLTNGINLYANTENFKKIVKKFDHIQIYQNNNQSEVKLFKWVPAKNNRGYDSMGEEKDDYLIKIGNNIEEIDPKKLLQSIRDAFEEVRNYRNN